jgi:hypothetical protein
MTPANFHEKLTAVLRDVARGTTADLADKMVAFWDWERVVYCFCAMKVARKSSI